MARFAVETYRPAYKPGMKRLTVKVRVHAWKGWSIDMASPDMTTLWYVDNVQTKDEAIALVIEHASHENPSVRRVR